MSATSSTGTAPSSASNIRERVEQTVNRAIQRSVKGLQLVTAPPAQVGLTPKDVVLERGTLRLYHYVPQSDEVYRVPVIIVMATTNKGFLFDLAPSQSFVEFLLQRGYDVYMIDWEAPQPEERHLNLASYTQDFIPSCVELVTQRSGEPDVSIIGYCAGGMLSVIYAATHPDGPLKNLVCFTTPINFKEMGLTNIWSDERYFDLDRIVDTLGIIPQEMITQSFEMQRPAQRAAGNLRLWDQMWNDQFVEAYRKMERWGEETLPLAGEYFRDTTRELTWRNKLYTGELVVDGKPAKLSNIKVPVLHCMAEHDHLVPYKAGKPLLEQVSSTDTQEILMKGGHVSLVAGPKAIGRLWPRVDEWLAERSV